MDGAEDGGGDADAVRISEAGLCGYCRHSNWVEIYETRDAAKRFARGVVAGFSRSILIHSSPAPGGSQGFDFGRDLYFR